VERFLVDRADAAGNAVGRLPWQADDVDGITTLDGAALPGDFLDVAVTEVVDDYDFHASIVARVPTVTRTIERRTRSLPMAVSMGSYGR
jgi:hypothetical protein